MPFVEPKPPPITVQRAVAEQVLETMANVRVFPGEVEGRDLTPTEDLLASSLTYTAPTGQLLLLECSAELAFQLTAHLFDRPRPTSVEDPDALDTMAELANTIGGNLKALMLPDTAIGLPAVVDARGRRALAQDAREISRMWLQTSFGLLCLTFFQLKPQEEEMKGFFRGQDLSTKRHIERVPTKES